MRSSFLLFPFLIVGVSGPGHAQDINPQDYYPLALGDTWDYSHVVIRCTDKDCDTSTNVYVRRTVVGEVDLEGETYAEMEVSVLDRTTAEELCSSQHAVRIDEETERVQIEDLSDECSGAFVDAFDSSEYLEEQIPLSLSEPAMDVVTIGGVDYDLLTQFGTAQPGLDEVQVTLAKDVGLVDLVSFVDPGPGGDESSYLSLVYAKVGGVTYGAAPVASEGVVSEPSFRLEAVYPNPTRSDATLTFTTTPADRVTAEVFDVLGRPVLRRDLGTPTVGASRRRLAVGALPAGLYVVRISTASGEVATQRFVKVD